MTRPIFKYSKLQQRAFHRSANGIEISLDFSMDMSRRTWEQHNARISILTADGTLFTEGTFVQYNQAIWDKKDITKRVLQDLAAWVHDVSDLPRLDKKPTVQWFKDELVVPVDVGIRGADTHIAVLGRDGSGDLITYRNDLRLEIGDRWVSLTSNNGKPAFPETECEIEHAFDLDRLAANPEAARELIADFFWESLNHELHDPYIRSNDPWLAGEPITWKQGQEDTLRQVIQATLWTDQGCFIKDTTASVHIYSRESRESPENQFYNVPETADFKRLQEIIEMVSQENVFSGTVCEYNDGAHDRRSGYSERPCSITIEVDAPSAQETAEALGHLRTYLTPRVADPVKLEQLLYGVDTKDTRTDQRSPNP